MCLPIMQRAQNGKKLILLPLRLPRIYDGAEMPVLLEERTQVRGAVDVIPDGLRLRHFTDGSGVALHDIGLCEEDDSALHYGGDDQRINTSEYKNNIREIRIIRR